MKELNSFTVERLEEFIRQPLENGLTRSEQMELARIALAAKMAEPIYQYQSGIGIDFNGGIEWVWYDCDKGFYNQYDHTRRRIVYTTPQLNSPEIPDSWKLVPIIAFPSQWAAGQKAHNDAGINKVDAVYKAMVAAAPDASGFDPSLPGEEATVITHYHTPDGYKLVPTEITKAMRDAWDGAPNCHEDDDVNMCNAYRAMIAAAPEKPL
ncbi:hypothetical protein [Yersinia kristensenii]|uniref:hypothetical protein n=1 Tax=Yersinia kristensenii TaxID=28152 RepID=UPI001FEC3DFB|nr:hypothetical protein [Yersinia kristensenii]